MPSKDYTIRELTAIFGKSQPCINNWITRGKLRAKRGLDGKWYVSSAALAEFNAERARVSFDPVAVTSTLSVLQERLDQQQARLDQQEAVIRKLVAAVKKLRDNS